MKIISSFKDYYDYVGYKGGIQDVDFKEKVYLRETKLKTAEAVLEKVHEHWRSNYYNQEVYVSKWWKENKRVLSLPDCPQAIRSGCIFVCGKAYPFLFLRDTAKIGTAGKGGQLKLSRCFNENIKGSIGKEQRKYNWEKDRVNEEDYNFFKPFFLLDEFTSNISLAEPSQINRWWWRTADNIFRKAKKFFDFYAGKDFTTLHLQLDCPIFLTLFLTKEAWRTGQKTEYEFMLNPNLSEFDFMRIVKAEILFQELEMFLGNVLVKDVMPFSHQSDFDKLTSHGFDNKISFRKMKDKIGKDI